MTIEEMIELVKNNPDKYELRVGYVAKILTNPYKGIYTTWTYENGTLIDIKEVQEGPIVLPTLFWY